MNVRICSTTGTVNIANTYTEDRIKHQVRTNKEGREGERRKDRKQNLITIFNNQLFLKDEENIIPALLCCNNQVCSLLITDTRIFLMNSCSED